MITKLPYHPKPKQNEGLNGFLLRLAEGNGCKGTRTLTGAKGLITAPTLATWLGANEKAQLGNLLIQLNYRNQSSRPLWNHQTSRYCPVCINTHQIWRQEWELTFLTVCPVHKCRLTDICQDCGARLTWKRKKLLSCDCDALLQTAKAIKASEAELALGIALQSKLTRKSCTHGLIGKLSIEQLYQLIVVLGGYTQAKPGGRPQKIGNKFHLEVAEKLTAGAAEILANWPTGFNALLDTLRSSHFSPTQTSSLTKQFGYIYPYIFKQMKAPEFRFILNAFEKYIITHWPQPINKRNKRISAELRSGSVWIPISVAAKELGTTSHQLTLLSNTRKIWLTSRETQTRRTVRCIERHKLPEIRLLLTDLINHETARRTLNITKKRLSQLLQYPIVTTAMAPKDWGSGKWAISRKSLQTLLSVGEGLPTTEETLDGQTIGMDFALRHWLNDESLFPALIEAVINGEIIPIATSSNVPGIPGWVFNYQQLLDWVQDRIRVTVEAR